MTDRYAARIEKIRAWHEKARHGTPDNYRFGDSSSDQAIDELIEIGNALLDERDELAKDAARYRYIRDKLVFAFGASTDGRFFFGVRDPFLPRAPTFDAAIDAAIEGEK